MYPQELGKYRILKLLPLGGMGRVYLAEDTESNTQVALKLIDLQGGAEQMEIVEAERRGAILQARLCGIDPRIVQINAYGDLGDYFSIEMEYVEGQDLSEVLAKGPLGIPFAARIGADLCEVLDVTHSFRGEIDGQSYGGIVHGDIKPRNIRITTAGQVKVLDFGIAKALSLTRQYTQNKFASSQYSSPERLSTGEVDVASDLWSVGVVLYEIVAGKAYFQGASPLPASLPAPFRAILTKALSQNPQSRYGSAAAFSSDLRAFLAGQSIAVQDDEAPTRRTIVPPPPVGKKNIKALVRIGVGLFVAILSYREYRVWAKGHDLQRDLNTQKLTDLNVAWTRYDELAQASNFPLALRGTRNAIEERLTSVADRVIEEYRNSDTPSVSEADWLRAADALSKALQLNLGDKEIRGKLLVCEGHVNRIKGEARKISKYYSEARSRFEQAQDLLPKSPDPYIGLGRVYAYSIRDADRAEDAIKQASRRGHKMGRREKAQLGDAFRDRAEKLVAEADRSSGLPEEKDFLKRAEEDMKKAEDFYRDIVPFAGSANSLRRVLDYLAAIDTRLQTIKDGV